VAESNSVASPSPPAGLSYKSPQVYPVGGAITALCTRCFGHGDSVRCKPRPYLLDLRWIRRPGKYPGRLPRPQRALTRLTAQNSGGATSFACRSQ